MAKTIEVWGKTYTLPPKGLYAGSPGKGPEGKQCRHCAHMQRVQLSKTYAKCGLMAQYHTGGKATDIQATAAACEKFNALNALKEK